MPSKGFAQNRIERGDVSVGPVELEPFRMSALAAATRNAGANQDAAQTAPPATTPSQPKPVEMPEGEGKSLAVQYCQDCHRLTNLTRAHQTVEQWKATVQTMMDSGARIPQENVDTLIQYLAKNFGPRAAPQTAVPAANGTVSPATGLPPAAPGAARVPELPDGEGKAIASEDCQGCHALTTLTLAHKSTDDWKDTVQSMIRDGAKVQADQVDTLVQYLGRNFGPKADDAPSTATPATSSPQAR